VLKQVIKFKPTQTLLKKIIINRFKHTTRQRIRKLKNIKDEFNDHVLLKKQLKLINILNNKPNQETLNNKLDQETSNNKPDQETSNNNQTITLSEANSLHKSYIIPYTIGTCTIGLMLSIVVENPVPLFLSLPIGVCAGMIRNNHAK